VAYPNVRPAGGASTIGIKSYAAGRAKFQGETLDWAWLDEEPPPEIYTECLTRTNVGNGPVWITFTPLLGMSETVRRFLTEKSLDRHVTQMDIDEAKHFSAEERKRIIASYPAHEREARTKGIPTLGSGRIFPIPKEGIAIEQRDIPNHWPRIGGLDFGWTHSSAAVELGIRYCESGHQHPHPSVLVASPGPSFPKPAGRGTHEQLTAPSAGRGRSGRSARAGERHSVSGNRP
jgi:phage terminase large subunit-like protein